MSDQIFINETVTQDTIIISDSSFVLSVNGKTGIVQLTPSDIGLDQVNNTSDLNKPLSLAALSALNALSAFDAGLIEIDINNLYTTLQSTSSLLTPLTLTYSLSSDILSSISSLSTLEISSNSKGVTYIQDTAPDSPSAKETWLRPAATNASWTNNYGMGLFVRNETNDAWIPTASVRYYDNGNMAGFVTIGNDGQVAIESFNYDATCRSTFIVGYAVQIWNGDLQVWNGDIYSRGFVVATESWVTSQLVALSGFDPASNPNFSNGLTVGYNAISFDTSGNLFVSPFGSSQIGLSGSLISNGGWIVGQNLGIYGGIYNLNSGFNPDGSIYASGNNFQVDVYGNIIGNTIAFPGGGGKQMYDDSGLQYGNQSVAMRGDNISEFTNDAGYLTSLPQALAPTDDVSFNSVRCAGGDAGFDGGGNVYANNLGDIVSHSASDFDPAGSASAAASYAEGLVSNISPLFPLGSCYYAAGGTGANPAGYQVKNQSGTLIGYLNLSWDGSPLVLIGVQATDASGTPLVHGTFAMYYDGDGNLTSAVCTN
jgi:hypothetical protein